METHRCVINSGSRTIEFPSQGVSLSISGPQVGKSFGNTPIVNLILKQRLVVPGGSEMEAMVEVEHNNFNHSWIVEGTPNMCCGLMVAHGIVNPKNGSVPLRVLPLRNEEVVVRKGTRIAVMEALEEDPHVDHHIGMVHRLSGNVSSGDQKLRFCGSLYLS